MQIRTLNQIINELKEIAKQHYQINSFTVGTLDDFATSGDTRYPAMWVSYENAAIAQRTESYTLSIWIVDRVKKDRSNLIEVHSDCKSILNDIKAQMTNPVYGWSLTQDWNYQAVFEPFMEDEVAGWFADITITQPFSNDSCQIPFIESPVVGQGSSGYSQNTALFHQFSPCYGSFYDTTTQTVAINGIAAMTFNSTDIPATNGVSIVSNSQITVAKSGVFDIQFSAQLHHKTGGGGGVGTAMWIWIKKNGANVSNSATRLNIQSGDYAVAAWNFVLKLKKNDYIQLAWSANTTDMTIEYESASSPYPAVPSLIVTMNQIA